MVLAYAKMQEKLRTIVLFDYNYPEMKTIEKTLKVCGKNC